MMADSSHTRILWKVDGQFWHARCWLLEPDCCCADPPALRTDEGLACGRAVFENNVKALWGCADRTESSNFTWHCLLRLPKWAQVSVAWREVSGGKQTRTHAHTLTHTHTITHTHIHTHTHSHTHTHTHTHTKKKKKHTHTHKKTSGQEVKHA